MKVNEIRRSLFDLSNALDEFNSLNILKLLGEAGVLKHALHDTGMDFFR